MEATKETGRLARAASGAKASSGAKAEKPKPLEPITRTHDIQEKRAPQQRQWEIGYRRFSEAGMSPEAMDADRMEELCQVMDRWPHARKVGISDFRKKEFVRRANRWSIACMKMLLKGDCLETSHKKLLEDVPEQFRSASGDHRLALKDMCEAHDGELREVSGSWQEEPGSIPSMQQQPNFYHCQYARNRIDYLRWQSNLAGQTLELPGPGELVNSILKMPASGGSMGGFGDEHYFVRSATIVGLGELLWFFGMRYTAAELYSYFSNARKLTLKRLYHGK